MKKLVLKNKENEVELEIRDARCNFCGEESETCVKGSLNLRVEVPKLECKIVRLVDIGDTESVEIVTEKKYHASGLFTSGYDELVASRYGSVVKDSIRFSEAYVKTGVETKTDQVDICFSCVRQLAELVNPLSPTRAGVIIENGTNGIAICTGAIGVPGKKKR